MSCFPAHQCILNNLFKSLSTIEYRLRNDLPRLLTRKFESVDRKGDVLRIHKQDSLSMKMTSGKYFPSYFCPAMFHECFTRQKSCDIVFTGERKCSLHYNRSTEVNIRELRRPIEAQTETHHVITEMLDIPLYPASLRLNPSSSQRGSSPHIMILGPPNGAASDGFADRFKMVPVSNLGLIQASYTLARFEHRCHLPI